jgi:2-polyprenyl-3-methyl-5-hydroxy-6-metoxy-1,4-benzoquinol methylase
MNEGAVESETQRHEAVAGDSWYAEGANAAQIRYLGGVFDRHWAGTSCLELGPAEGLMTERIAERFRDVVLVDGSERFCGSLRERFPGAEVVCSLFEDYEPGRRFDTIVLGHVLEHVEDPEALVRRAAGWVAPGGRLLAAVPNGRSVHRQMAVVMGLLGREDELNETDRHHGHRRVYYPESVRAAFVRNGWDVEVFGGYWLKPLSNAQIERDWTAEMLDAAFRVGERYPDIAAEIYVVCRPSSSAVTAASTPS